MDEQSLLVRDALRVTSHRVRPEDPIAHVIELIVREEVPAVPVVGESNEVLGVITAGDALDQLLQLGPSESSDPEQAAGQARTARDVMTRTVLCVSEDQSLLDAAKTMANRHVEQLPVVREGEFIGFVTRDSVLRALHPDSTESDT